MPAAAVTVAIVSWNTRDLLARCLESLDPEVRAGRANAWVVDNASSDGSAELVRERFDWAHLVASRENLGFGAAVNLVARETSSEWIATANADVALRPGALERLLEAGDRDRRAGAVAPRLVLADGQTQHSAFAFPTIAFALLFAVGALHIPAVGDCLVLPGRWNAERARRVPWAVAAFLLVRRAAWEQAGGFDERQWLYAEDLDLGWRLRDAGWVTRYEPTAVVDHEQAAATAQLFGPDPAPRWQRSTYACIARRRGVGYARTVALLNVLGALVRWGGLAVASLLRPGRHAPARRAYGRWVGLHLSALRPGVDLESLR